MTPQEYSDGLSGANFLCDNMICLVVFGLEGSCGQLGLLYRKNRIFSIAPGLLIQVAAPSLHLYM
jgi:hypothetical protein